MIVILLLAGALLCVVEGKTVTVSNTQLPLDTAGDLLITGELSVVSNGGVYYFYSNNWGGCAGVDCCNSTIGCATCCFSPPSPQYPDACVYTTNHSVVAYATTDFVNFQWLGVVLPLSSRLPGIEFRPQVVYHKASATYIMWYEDRWIGQDGYAVATSVNARGPFVTAYNSVKLAGPGRVGDYDVFIDDDDAATAYHVRTGITIVKLTADYMNGTDETYTLTNGNVEGPSMFKRQGFYYVLVGQGCCACIGGSNIVVYRSKSPLGPYELQGDVGSNTSQKFDRHSRFNYVTHAQGSKVITVPDGQGSVQYVWIGNQWVTSTLPGRPRNHDLLYWAVLEFDSNNNIVQLVRQDNVTIHLPDIDINNNINAEIQAQ